ncbi:phosphatase domain-containing putative toxin [Veillonella ratti]|uniref:phosphatase domain-containing putative toxin n=1 Tax=Veillonella ratti TaxID=103892 RepID=UPI000F8C5EBA|nr:protein tyrosine phosphatase [Veillonella ratti]
MKRKSNSIWQRAAMMTIIGTTLYGTAFASEAVLPKEAIPRLQLPTQETLLESKNEHQKTSKAVAKQTQAAINPNQLYADKRLINPYTTYMWREDNENTATLPPAFRTYRDRFKTDTNLPTRKGLDTLNISGSSQPSAEQLAQIANTLRTKTDGPIYVVDLRQETHLFVNGIPVSHYGKRNWGNVGKSYQTIINEERDYANKLVNTALPIASLDADKNAFNEQTITVTSAKTEETVAKELGLRYVRFTATDHTWPDEASIDRFIAFYKTLPKNAWLHFHCEAGKGRTTAFMAMYDIMKNPDVPLADILARQQLIGGNNVAATSDKDTWKAPYYEEKAVMINKFYRYVQQNYQTGFELSWSEWLNPKPQP